MDNVGKIYAVTPKDWERMQDLIDRNQDGEGVASKIKEVGKAAARFIAGTILNGDREGTLKYKSLCWSHFRAFGQKAIQLGATWDDLLASLEQAQVPENFKDTHVTKACYQGYTGSMYRFLDQMEAKYGITRVEEHADYRSWSYETANSYNRNGLVWPLDYKFTLKKGDKETSFTLIVVTSEAGGNYGYDYNRMRLPWTLIKKRIEERIQAELL